MEDKLKISIRKISTTTVWIVTYEFFRGRLRGNLEFGSAQPSLYLSILVQFAKEDQTPL
jgi:hypothetical protein